MNATQKFDSRPFRDALGAFTTGVTIVTTRDADGRDIGLTANSFNSVSLDPPLVLWSLAKSSLSLAAFKTAEYFAVHVLAADQERVSNLFATRGADKFAGLAIERGHGGVPLLDGCAARFECRTAFQYDGGDHEIFVGEVIAFNHYQRPPLVFQAGRYAVAVKKPPAALPPEPEPIRPNGSFGKDYLGFLVSIAHHQLRTRVRPRLAEMGITEDDNAVLTTLMVRDGRSERELTALLDYMGRGVAGEMFEALAARGLIRREAGPEGATLWLTEAGRRAVIEIVAMTKAIESHAENCLDYGEIQLFKQLLRKIIRSTAPENYSLWDRKG
ncbi:MAG: flavin reductase [Gammaproteobacteria bacterium]